MTDPYRPAGPWRFQGQPSDPSGYPFPPPGPDRQFQIKLRKHTGLLIVFQYRTYVVTGTLQQCEHAYRQAQTHNLLAGWWSFLSAILLNWIALCANLSAMSQLRRLAERPEAFGCPPVAHQTPWVPAGWYRDPHGAPGQRFWDGTSWTEWTHGAGQR